MDAPTVVVPVLALIASAASLGVALRADYRSQKAEAIRNLLGEKETVSFGALKLSRDGFPKSRRDRQLLIEALIQACLLEGSDRARAYRSMAQYAFSPKELDLTNGKRRLAAARKVLKPEVAPTG